ncbi:2-polyprenyl-6-methoxyphenol hydroxylase [Xylona heveae TC161]|uniref:2-polyprenyl-6-methoxyphenol hydroxylase n=1 Tax=Xylona heveae (strain CBS 132557 / TC161) TaxID=1328760 RepID=A0A165GQC2_XYLHT|nr:2-polyprenyl-6-methoxyphenol hydroxylase [Xylona heveae TC161]KZF22465.1 2-polyprenyl-6-methoxyphenol hydroxylase [Xylona heveae TC161]
MTQLRVLICGAGIAGNALAFWLSKLGHSTTVIEHFPSLRATGLQVDLRGPGIQVMQRMGLETAFRARSVPEQGLQLVDRKGRRWGYFPANRSGKGLQSFTTDFEIMRGDLCRLLHDATKDRAKYVFGQYVRRIEQTDDFAEVLFSDGSKERFDLVVGADGQGSRTRKMMLNADAADPFHPLGAYAGYFTIDQELQEGEGYNATAFIATQGRGIMTRRHDPSKFQAYLFCNPGSSDRLKLASKGDTDEEKQALAEVFHGAGWQTEQILKGLARSDDFYCERIGTVQLDHWSRARIALVGDAAYCPSAMTGMGTTCGIVGAYILAGEIEKFCGRGSKDADVTVSKDSITTALKSYEQKLRPFMDQVQKGLTDDQNYMDKFPSSSFGIAFIYAIFGIASFFRLDFIARWILREDIKGWELPKYQEMLINVLDT